MSIFTSPKALTNYSSQPVISQRSRRKDTQKDKKIRTSTKSPKVLGSLGNNISSDFHDDTSGGLSTDGDVEVAFGVGPIMFLSLKRSVVRFDERDSLIQISVLMKMRKQHKLDDTSKEMPSRGRDRQEAMQTVKQDIFVVSRCKMLMDRRRQPAGLSINCILGPIRGHTMT